MQEIEISRWLFDRKANPANLATIFCPVLVDPQKAIVGIIFLAYFCGPLVKCQIDREDFVNFCGLFRKYELYLFLRFETK